MTSDEFFLLNDRDQENVLFGLGDKIIDCYQGESIIKIYKIYNFIVKVSIIDDKPKFESINKLDKFSLFESK